MKKMSTKEVFDLIYGEREYQDTERKINENDLKDDSEKSLADFVIYIENKLNAAKDGVYMLDDDHVRHNLRKIAALAVAAMEAHGGLPRD